MSNLLPRSHDLEAIERSYTLLKFAAENKTGLAGAVVIDLELGWSAADAKNWTPEIATKFWVAYDALNSHIKPVTLDSLAASSANIPRISLFGTDDFTSRSAKTASFYLSSLILFLVTTMIIAFIASASDTLVKELEDLRKEGDNKVVAIRDRFASITPEISNASSLDSAELTAGERKWVSEIRSELQNLYYVADQMYLKVNSSAFWLLRVDPLRLCANYEDVEGCYQRGSLGHPKYKEAIAGNIEDYYRTRREIAARKDQAKTRLDMLKSYILPALLGFLGACTYVVRLLSEQIRDVTFTSTSPIRHLLRVAIGSLAGVIVVMGNFLATAGLSSLALSFLAGYAMEALFASIDGIVAKFKN